MIAYFALIGLPPAMVLAAVRWMPVEAAGALGLAVSITMFFLHGVLAARPGSRMEATLPRDAVHAVLSGAGAQAVILASVLLAGRFGLDRGGVPWSLAFQVAIVVLVSDFLGYWSHRLVHQVPFLWPIHALHHTPKRLYWLNGLRSHAFDSILTTVIITSWAILLGFSMESLVLAGLFTTGHLMLQHSTVAMPSRLSIIFATPEWHITHHDSHAGRKPMHLGRIFSLWDRMFATASASRTRPGSLGVIGLEDLSLAQELALPFRGEPINPS